MKYQIFFSLKTPDTILIPSLYEYTYMTEKELDKVWSG